MAAWVREEEKASGDRQKKREEVEGCTCGDRSKLETF